MTDWKKLKHLSGAAADVPRNIARLSGKADYPAHEAAGALHNALVGAAKWSSASVPSIELLLKTLPTSAHKAWLLMLAADIAGGDHVRGWLAPSTRSGAPPAVDEALATLAGAAWKLATSKDANERATALVHVALLPSATSEQIAKVTALATSDKDAVVRASAVLALARLGEADPRTAQILRKAAADSAAVVRGAAALAVLRLDPSRAIDKEAAGLEDWLGQRSPETDNEQTVMPWFGGMGLVMHGWKWQFLPPAAQGLVALARRRGDEERLVRLALAIGVATSSGVVARACGRMLLALGGFTRFAENDRYKRFVALPEELSKTERALAKELAGTMLLPDAGLGLPAAGEVRKRWIGVAPAAGLEKKVKYKTKAGPFWRMCFELEQSGIFGDPFPPPLDDALDGFERWRALVELGAGSYGGGSADLDAETIEAELAKVTLDDKLVVRLGVVADDLSARFAAADREGKSLTSSLVMCLLFLPLVRKNKRIEPRWDRLICLADDPIAREVLQALPPDRREALLFATTPPEENDDPFPELDQVIPILDVAPSKRIVQRIAKHLAKPDVRKRLRDFDTLEAYQKKLKAVARVTSHAGT